MQHSKTGSAKLNRHWLSKNNIISLLNDFWTNYDDYYLKAITVVILTGKLYYMEELVISKKGLSEYSWIVLCCTEHPAWPSNLCWAAKNPWLQDHISWFTATGCSCWVPAIATPSCSCLHPEVQQNVMWASFLFDSRNHEHSRSNSRNSLK